MHKAGKSNENIAEDLDVHPSMIGFYKCRKIWTVATLARAGLSITVTLIKIRPHIMSKQCRNLEIFKGFTDTSCCKMP